MRIYVLAGWYEYFWPHPVSLSPECMMESAVQADLSWMVWKGAGRSLSPYPTFLLDQDGMEQRTRQLAHYLLDSYSRCEAVAIVLPVVPLLARTRIRSVCCDLEGIVRFIELLQLYAPDARVESVSVGIDAEADNLLLELDTPDITSRPKIRDRRSIGHLSGLDSLSALRRNYVYHVVAAACERVLSEDDVFTPGIRSSLVAERVNQLGMTLQQATSSSAVLRRCRELLAFAGFWDPGLRTVSERRHGDRAEVPKD